MPSLVTTVRRTPLPEPASKAVVAVETLLPVAPLAPVPV